MHLKHGQSLFQRLEDYWLSLRLSDSPIPAEHMLMENTSHVGVGITQSNAPTLNDALALYLRLKSEGKSDTFVRGAKRNIGFVVSALGDRPIDMIGGWNTAGVGQTYGNGYPLDVLNKWMRKVLIENSSQTPISVLHDSQTLFQ